MLPSPQQLVHASGSWAEVHPHPPLHLSIYSSIYMCEADHLYVYTRETAEHAKLCETRSPLRLQSNEETKRRETDNCNKSNSL